MYSLGRSGRGSMLASDCVIPTYTCKQAYIYLSGIEVLGSALDVMLLRNLIWISWVDR